MHRRAVVGLLGASTLAACAPTARLAGTPGAGFAGPRFEDDRFVSYDGARLGLSRWEAQGEPWAVIIGLHGMNSYARAFRQAGPFWGRQGITTYAYDQRGHGRSPGRGEWFADEVLTEDLRTAVSLARAAHPRAQIVVAGESMGGAVAIQAFTSDRPPMADRLVLLAPAVWGWSSQPLPYKTSLWVAARAMPRTVVTPPRVVTNRIQASDNMDELIDMGRDRLMIFGAQTGSIYGLVGLMERAWRNTGRLRVPTFYLYGARDEIIPRAPSLQASGRLTSSHRTAFYSEGWHLLLVDRQAETVWRDVIAFVGDPAAPLPSGAPIIPGARTRNPPARTAAATPSR